MGKRENKHWEQEEVDYLKDKWGSKSADQIAKYLGRSVQAVISKKERLGLGYFSEQCDQVAFTYFIKTLYGADSQDTRDRLIREGLPVVKKKAVKEYIWLVDIKKFWKWAEVNKDKINFSKMEKYDFGPEPDWVEIKRHSDKNKHKTLKIKQPWTKEEEEKLKYLINQYTWTYKQIAKMLNRTEAACYARAKKLGIKGLPLKATPRAWEENEVKLVLEMKGKGYTLEDISDALNTRSVKAIKGLLIRIKKAPTTDQSKIGA